MSLTAPGPATANHSRPAASVSSDARAGAQPLLDRGSACRRRLVPRRAIRLPRRPAESASVRSRRRLTAATLLAVALAYWRRTTVVSAALSLDERFQLKERITTSLTLDPRDGQSPAALALLADVERRVAPLYVSERFPIKVPWSAALVPVAAVVLVLLAFFYKPALNQAQASDQKDEKDPQNLVDAAEAPGNSTRSSRKLTTAKSSEHRLRP